MKCHPERWVWGLIPIAMLSWIAIDAEADRIERDLEQRSRRVLAAAGLDWASIAFSGRDGLLVGTPRGPREREVALKLVRSVWGVRMVTERTRSLEELAAVDLAPEHSRRISPQETLQPTRPADVSILPARHPSSAATAEPATLREPQPDAVRAYEPAAGSEAMTGPRPGLVALEPPVEPPAAVTKPHAETAKSDAPSVAAPLDKAGSLPDAANALLPPAAAKVPELPIVAPQPAETGPKREPAKVEEPPAPPVAATADAAPASSSSGGNVSIATAVLARSVALAADRCRIATENLRIPQPIRFATGAADLTSGQRQVLDQLAAAANACPRARLKIAGHADADGAARRNMTLSLRRADVVVGYLISKGIDAGRLKAVGYGETRPIAPNNTARNRAKNRRIEVEVTGLRPPEEGPAASAGEGAGNGLPDR